MKDVVRFFILIANIIRWSAVGVGTGSFLMLGMYNVGIVGGPGEDPSANLFALTLISGATAFAAHYFLLFLLPINKRQEQ